MSEIIQIQQAEIVQAQEKAAIDVQIALRLDGQVIQAMAPKGLEHVVEEADARTNVELASAVELERNADVGLLRRARYLCIA